MERLPCSVPILTLNAREGLERLLPSLVERFDDVFIIDGNSTDGTREYAQSLGVRIEDQYPDRPLQNQVINDFAAMRRRSWSLARHSWILWLDADEVPDVGLLDRVSEIIRANDAHQAHRIVRVPQLPDGRIVMHGFYFPERIIRLFHRDAGLRLVDRPVHEKFIIPDGVRMVDHEERILAPWSTPEILWRRQRRYVELDNAAVVPTWPFLLRWVWWYNLVSLAGQFLRACRSSWRGLMHAETALPWNYNLLFFRYRVLRLVHGTHAWAAKRYRA